MNSQDFLAVRNQLPELRKKVVDSDFGQVPKSIEYLERAITDASIEDKAPLYSLLLSECTRSRNQGVYIYFLHKRAREIPSDPFSFTELGTALAHEQSTQDEALRIAEQAVDLAKRQDRLLKYSLTCQARVALEIGNYDVFNSALRGLIEDADKYRSEDHGLEFDFLDRADPNQADKELMTQYRALAA